MIVDFHSHDFPDEIAVQAMSGMCRKTEGRLWAVGDGTMMNHLDCMDSSGVDLAVLCQIATRPQQWKFLLERAMKITAGEFGLRAQRKLVPFGSVHPEDPDAVKHIRAFSKAGVKGIKFHPYYQDFSLVDSRVLPIFREIANCGLIVACHSGGDVCWSEVRGRCGPEEIAQLLDDIPDLKFVAAHLGGCYGYPSRATDVLLRRNVYIDTSVLAFRWHYDEEMRLLRSWPSDRILFATDFPWVNYAEAIANVRLIRNQCDWERLFAGNALRLLSGDV